MICWDPVVLDQCGRPEVVVEYVLDYSTIRMVGLPAEPLFRQQVAATVPVPVEECTGWAVGTPLVGEAVQVEIGGVDVAGNEGVGVGPCP